MRRGFKSEATTIALDVRGELGLTPFDALDPHQLASHLEIPVMALSELHAEATRSVEYFLNVDGQCFSGLTVFDGARRMIVYNDSHASTRQVSDIVHETAHGLLLHQPLPAFDHRGFRYHDAEREDEAAFLTGALLVTEAAAMRIVKSGEDLDQAAARLGISDDMVRYRINVTGARRRVARSARWR